MQYDEISPITNNRSVLIEPDPNTGIDSRICMESGYTTTDRLIIGSQPTLDYEAAGLSEFMKSMKYEDELLGTTWYPAFIQMQNTMLYCERKTETSNEIIWKVAKVVNIIGDDRLQFPVPGKDGEYYTSRLDVENALTFEKFQFKAALDQCYSYATTDGDWSPIEDASHIQKD